MVQITKMMDIIYQGPTADLVCQVFYIHVIFTKAMQREYYSPVFPIDRILCYVMRNLRLK